MEEELALTLGISQNTISNIVNGHIFPKPVLLLAIANELDVDVRDLFISTKEKDINDPNEAMKEIKRIVDKFNSK